MFQEPLAHTLCDPPSHHCGLSPVQALWCIGDSVTCRQRLPKQKVLSKRPSIPSFSQGKNKPQAVVPWWLPSPWFLFGQAGHRHMKTSPSPLVPSLVLLSSKPFGSQVLKYLWRVIGPVVLLKPSGQGFWPAPIQSFFLSIAMLMYDCRWSITITVESLLPS